MWYNVVKHIKALSIMERSITMSEKRRDNKNRILRTGESQRKDGSGNRCAKQSGKTGAHAAHNHNTRVFVIKVQELGKKVANRTADLQCRTFTSRRTAAEVCQQGGKNN